MDHRPVLVRGAPPRSTRTDGVQTTVGADLVDAELERGSVEVAGRGDGDVVGEIVGVVVLGRPRGLLHRLVVPVVCPPQVERDSVGVMDLSATTPIIPLP